LCAYMFVRIGRLPRSPRFPYTTLFRFLAMGAAGTAPPVAAQSLTDRFKSLFGGGSDDKEQQNLPASGGPPVDPTKGLSCPPVSRSEEHTSELQSHLNLVCRILPEKKKH